MMMYDVGPPTYKLGFKSHLTSSLFDFICVSKMVNVGVDGCNHQFHTF